ncbi:hypothetical protein P8C59_003428 [Phyllachora maydis]|uniref:Pheromone receptor n=1 Tax=Phyllachora maydis TaxID=1825666 RepID=A0AAD9MCE1_9PEZI|nr:hypothetical protein P8C59_003428 [Phyllachora maydis]
MKANMSNGAAGGPFNPLHQSFAILAADGATTIPVSVSDVDAVYDEGLATQANYGAQFGATFILFVVLLTLTPGNRFLRRTTVINLMMLGLSCVRSLMACFFFTSSWFEFYALFAGDFSFVPRRDYNLTAAATALSVPVVVAMEAALALQAWSMLQLWPAGARWAGVGVSGVLVLCVVGFRLAVCVLNIESAWYDNVDVVATLWVQKAELAFRATSIFWFCLLFISRLVWHLWTNRSVLPSAQGLSAMEVLIMTNGVLMLVPVLFAGLEFGNFVNFEPQTLTTTTVTLILPLGTLIAQRLATPQSSVSQGSDVSGGRATTGTSGKPLLRSWKKSVATRQKMPNTHQNYYNHGSTGSMAARPEKAAMQDPIDLELARIDFEEKKGSFSDDL